jgi:ubiquinone/menaquinone biosynthesis C-methylase UbiE
MDHNKVAVAIFNKLAEGYQEKFMNVDLYSASLDFYCDQLKKPGLEILDIACGPGNITQYLYKKRPDLKITGVDLAPKMIELAQTNNPKCNFKVMDGRALSSMDKKWDGLVCGFLLPYLSKEETLKLIVDAAQQLNAGGLLYVSTMENDYRKSGLKKGSSGDEIYMYYHESEYLINALERSQLEVLKIDRKTYNYQGEATTDLIIIAKKKG